MTSNKCIIAVFSVGAIFVIIGGVLIPVFKKIIHDKISEKVPLINGTEAFDNWMNPPVPVFFEAYIFHYVNSAEIMSRGDKPIVQQKGPYTYREEIEKFDVEIENGTISYRERKTYIFDRDRSAGHESDVFTMPNLPVLTIINMVRYSSGLIRTLVSVFTGIDKIFTDLTVHDILWGYHDQKIDSIRKLIPSSMNVTIPKMFGIFYGKNGTDDGTYVIYSGADGIKNLGLIKTWNNISSLPYWNSPQCRMINGSDGTVYPPFLDKDSVVYIFSTDICRSVYAVFEKTDVVQGIQVNKYTPPPNLFSSGDIYPPNKGFCTPDCLPSGLLNVSKCHQNAPVVLSQPHFFQAAQSVINSVEGVHPKRDKHATVLEIEPLSGMGLNLAKRLQINLRIAKVQGIPVSANIDNQILPVVWINENAKIDEDLAKKFKREVENPIQIMNGVTYGLIALGIAIILISLLVVMKKAILTPNNDYEKISASSSQPEPSTGYDTTGTTYQNQ